MDLKNVMFGFCFMIHFVGNQLECDTVFLFYNPCVDLNIYVVILDILL